MHSKFLKLFAIHKEIENVKNSTKKSLANFKIYLQAIFIYHVTIFIESAKGSRKNKNKVLFLMAVPLRGRGGG